MRALEHALQRLQLAAVERGAVPPLLLLPLGGAAAPGTGTLTCGRRRRSPRVSRAEEDSARWVPAAPLAWRDRRGDPEAPTGHHRSGTCSAVCTELLGLPLQVDGPAPRAGAPPLNSLLPSSIHPFFNTLFPEHLLWQGRGYNGESRPYPVGPGDMHPCNEGQLTWLQRAQETPECPPNLAQAPGHGKHAIDICC